MIVVGSPHCGLREGSSLGGEVYERELLARLPAHGIFLELGLPRGRAVRERTGWSVTLLWPSRGLRWYVAPLAFVPFVVGLSRNAKIDVIRGHSVLFTGPSLLAARRLAGSHIPMVLHHLHTDPALARLEAAILRRADAVITISEFSRRQLNAYGIDDERIHVVYPGVVRPPSTVQPLTAIWPQGLRLLYLGRLIDRKQPAHAIATLAELHRRGVAAGLVMAGDGPLRRRLRRQAEELGVKQSIVWLSDITERRKWELYAGSDVVLFPSMLEGFGFVVAEAQAAGTPVVVVEQTAAAEIIVDGTTGFAVTGEPSAFADAVIRLNDGALRARMGTAARDRARQFDWEACARAIARIYEMLAHAQPGSEAEVRGARSAAESRGVRAFSARMRN